MTERPNINLHLANCNGFDQTFHHPFYAGVVYSPMVRWLMGNEAKLHWLVSDLLVTCGPMGPKVIKDDWHITAKFNHATGIMSYEGADPRTGHSVVVHSQRYESHDCTENLVFYIRDHEDGGRPCKIVLMAAED